MTVVVAQCMSENSKAISVRSCCDGPSLELHRLNQLEDLACSSQVVSTGSVLSAAEKGPNGRL